MKYEVISNIRAGGEDYAPGDTIDLDPEEAAGIPWAVKALDDEGGAEEDGDEWKDLSVAVVMDIVSRDPQQAAEALVAEVARGSKARKSLVSRLEEIIAASGDEEEDDLGEDDDEGGQE